MSVILSRLKLREDGGRHENCKTNNIFVRPSLEFWCPPEQHIILTTMSSPELTEAEMEVVMAVFKSYETGLREATIYPKVE